MIVKEAGHWYLLEQLDDILSNLRLDLIFVKREGDKYPGNVGHHPGTNLQEVFRACIDRLNYLQSQESCVENSIILHNLKTAIWLLELRAARRHGRELPPNIDEIEKRSTCTECGHVCCRGECHP